MTPGTASAKPLSTTMNTLAPGTVLGRYEIVSLVGSGGMGEVYRARDPRLNRQVALKIVRMSLRDDANVVRRFEQEALAAATLNHPNILAVHDVGVHGGQPYIVSELLDGVSLREVLARPVSIDKAVQYAIDICNGLAAAHERGIVHRDLKPENLVVTRHGHVKILDFGLAKLNEGPQTGAGAATQSALTAANTILGTVGYMSPEQVSGREVDHRTDLFSVGTVLYELVSGRRAFAGDSAAETLSAVLKDDPPPLSGADALSTGVFRVIRHCLEKDPSRRFQSARDMVFALESIPAAVHEPGARVSSRTPGATAVDSAGPHRLIVPSFENLSGQGDDEWLGAALSDSLAFGLRHVENIIIVNRQHAGAFTDPQQLFNALDVRYCVRGSYQRVGEDIKVLVRLIHAHTGTIAVQESVTDRFSNLLALEDTLAARFAAAFEQTRSEAIPRRTASLSAYKRLSQARELQLTGRYEEAAHDLELAVKHDPEYADAWALLANNYGRLTSPATADDSERAEFLHKALAAARRAVQLDPALYEGQVALALAYRGIEEVELWRTAALKATELNPRLPEAYVLLGQSVPRLPCLGLRAAARQRTGGAVFSKGLAARSAVRPCSQRAHLSPGVGGSGRRGATCCG